MQPPSTAPASQHPPLLEKYITMYIAELVQAGRFLDAVHVFEQYDTPVNALNTYKMLIDVVGSAG